MTDPMKKVEQSSNWVDPSTQPKPHDGMVIFVKRIEVWRWKAYKPGAPKHLLEKGGRWQEADEWGGWDNVDTDGVPYFWLAEDKE